MVAGRVAAPILALLAGCISLEDYPRAWDAVLPGATECPRLEGEWNNRGFHANGDRAVRSVSGLLGVPLTDAVNSEVRITQPDEATLVVELTDHLVNRHHRRELRRGPDYQCRDGALEMTEETGGPEVLFGGAVIGAGSTRRLTRLVRTRDHIVAELGTVATGAALVVLILPMPIVERSREWMRFERVIDWRKERPR